ncbi:MAG TPA: CBS domain-containing protein, partial [Chroococcales cyanobacterium]
FAWVPSQRLTAIGARIAVWCTPTVAWLLRYLNPLTSRFTAWTNWHRPDEVHNGLYEKSDLLEFIEHQKYQADSRIPLEELELVERALQFDQVKVRHVFTSRKKVKAVGRGDAVGPILLDELHAAGHSRYPVFGKDENDIVGTIHVVTLDEAKQGGHVRDFMDKGVAYLHEGDTLLDALRAVYQTKHQLFVVVNSFEEYVGILTLEDILQTLAGVPMDDEFDAYHNLVAVASRHPSKKKPKAAAEKPAEESVSPEETPEPTPVE